VHIPGRVLHLAHVALGIVSPASGMPDGGIFGSFCVLRGFAYEEMKGRQERNCCGGGSGERNGFEP